tara:strand:+ start:277 stop:498 length:222 start_codon:yes stop_codon:yes gene_type:complete
MYTEVRYETSTILLLGLVFLTYTNALSNLLLAKSCLTLSRYLKYQKQVLDFESIEVVCIENFIMTTGKEVKPV